MPLKLAALAIKAEKNLLMIRCYIECDKHFTPQGERDLDPFMKTKKAVQNHSERPFDWWLLLLNKHVISLNAIEFYS
jgi:hypothetical protein